MSGWQTAVLYGLLSASGLIAGALAGLRLQIQHRTNAAVTAVGVGLLIAAASLYLISGAVNVLPAHTAALGALIGAAVSRLASAR